MPARAPTHHPPTHTQTHTHKEQLVRWDAWRNRSPDRFTGRTWKLCGHRSVKTVHSHGGRTRQHLPQDCPLHDAVGLKTQPKDTSHGGHAENSSFRSNGDRLHLSFEEEEEEDDTRLWEGGGGGGGGVPFADSPVINSVRLNGRIYAPTVINYCQTNLVPRRPSSSGWMKQYNALIIQSAPSAPWYSALPPTFTIRSASSITTLTRLRNVNSEWQRVDDHCVQTRLRCFECSPRSGRHTVRSRFSGLVDH